MQNNWGGLALFLLNNIKETDGSTEYGIQADYYKYLRTKK